MQQCVAICADSSCDEARTRPHVVQTTMQGTTLDHYIGALELNLKLEQRQRHQVLLQVGSIRTGSVD